MSAALNQSSSRINPDLRVATGFQDVAALSVVPLPMSVSLAVSNVILAGLFVLMHWSAVDHGFLTTWMSLVILLAVLELSARLLIASPHVNVNTVSRGRWWAVSVDVCVGLLWLFAAVFFYPAGHDYLPFFYLFTLVAIALCTAVYQHFYLVSCFVRIGFAIPVAAVQVLYSTEIFGGIQALLVVGVWLSIIWLAFRLHSGLLGRIKLTQNRDALVQKVAEHTSELAELRAVEAESRKRAESANLAKSRFLAHSSHDLRQPLHAISLLLETVDDEHLDKSTGHVVSRVRQSVELLAKLFDSLLDLTLLDTGQVEIAEVVFSLDSVYADVASDFKAVAEANGVSITVKATNCHVSADPTVVRRMIQNMVANAIRHAPDGTVEISGRKVSGEIYICVVDNGAGIAQDDQERIFEEFTKLDENMSNESAGSLGLGLAIVNRLARLSGSRVTVESQPGQGSCFAVGPFPVRTAIEGPPVRRAIPLPDLGRVNVVVVDDDRDTLKATGRLLNKWGFDVTLLHDGNVEEIDRPEILVCDYDLGHQLSGIDVIHRTREIHGVAVPALLISGNTSPELAARAAAENLRLLHKPVRPAQLKSAILTLLGTQAPRNFT